MCSFATLALICPGLTVVAMIILTLCPIVWFICKLLQPDYFTAKATAVFYKKDNCLYKVRIRVINDYLPSR